MSASREKQNRQAGASRSDPKTAREAQQRKEEQRSNLLYGLIAAAFVVVVIVSIVWRSDLLPRMTNAATVDGQKYSAAEVGYYYQSAYRNFLNQYSYFASYLGLDSSVSLKNQELSQTAAGMLGLELPETDAENTEDGEAPSTGITWHEYFMDEALENISVIQASLKAAEAEGFVYPDSVRAQYDDSMASLRSAAAANGISVSRYLKSSFGSGITEKIYGEQFLKVLRYSAYADAYQNSLNFSNSELEEVYNSDRNSYDHVTYETVSFSGAAESTTDEEGNEVEPTEEESAAALESARQAAQAVLDGFKNGGNLETLADEQEGTYNKTEKGSYYADNVVSEWLYSGTHKDGDATVLEDGTIEYVVVFRDRFRDENPTIDIRHILVPLGTATLTENDEGYAEEQEQLKANAHARAEELLAQWQSGEATEDSFAALAMAESTDGSKYNGGLYTEVYQGQMVTEFNDWCFDGSRKPGDTGVVDTQYGSHVMYFSGSGLNRWQAQAAGVLRDEAYGEWEDQMVENVAIQRNESGLKYIG